MSRDLWPTVQFAALVCVVCSVLVSGSAVVLGPKQAENRLLDRQRRVLEVVGLVGEGEAITPTELRARFSAKLEARLIDLETGAFVEGADPLTYDARRAAKDPATSRPAPPNPAAVRRLPKQTVVYLLRSDEGVEAYVLPIEGLGLWSTLYGYLALDRDGTTIRGLTYYEHGETPGLGGEVDNPAWKARWKGRRAFDDRGEVAIQVARGHAGPPDADPYRVDGISGATLTCTGVSNMMRFWLGPDGFGPFLARVKEAKP